MPQGQRLAVASGVRMTPRRRGEQKEQKRGEQKRGEQKRRKQKMEEGPKVKKQLEFGL